MSSPDNSNNKFGVTKKQGVEWVFPGTETSYDAPAVTADIISGMRHNHLMAKVERVQRQLIFTKPFTISVKSSDNDEPDEKLTEALNDQTGHVDLWTLTQKWFGDVFYFGAGLGNPVWGYSGNSYEFEDVRYLPAESFKDEGGANFAIQSKILKGIGLEEVETGKYQMAYYQTQENGQVEQLDTDSVYLMKDPLAPGIAGTPVCLPLVALISQHKYTAAAQMQKVNRIGAPKPYLRFTEDPADASQQNGGISDEQWANLFLQDDSKDTCRALRKNMELVNPYLTDDQTALDTMEYLEKKVLNFFNASDIISKDGTLIGGSSASEMALTLRYISGWHEVLEAWISDLLTPFIDGNLYEGYYISVDIPEPEVDTSELDLKRAQVALQSDSIVPANEFLRMLGLAENEEFQGQYLKKAAAPVAQEGQVETFQAGRNGAFEASMLDYISRQYEE